MKKENKGFTVAELLVVVVIIGILVAVSIPIFVGKLTKTRVATNKANIRAAKAAAMAEIYNGIENNSFVNYGNDGKYAYYEYDISKGKLITHYNYKYVDGAAKGEESFDIANSLRVCPTIWVYVCPETMDAHKGQAIQTSPYYTEASGNNPAISKKKNTFGPNPGEN